MLTACSGTGAAPDGVPEFKLSYMGEFTPGLYNTTVEIALENGDVMLFDLYDSSDSMDIDDGTYELSTSALSRIFIWTGAEFESNYLKSVISVETVADSLAYTEEEFATDFNSVTPGTLELINDAEVNITSEVSADVTTYTFEWNCNSGDIIGTYTGSAEVEEDMSAR